MTPFNSIEGETWADCPGMPGHEVSDLGRVRVREGESLWLKSQPLSCGYRVICTTPTGGRRRSFYVHRLVLEAFQGPCPAGMVCRHLNDEKTDNRLANLAYGTRIENYEDAVRNGRCLPRRPAPVPKGRRRGTEIASAKLTDELVMSMRRDYAMGETIRQIAKRSGLSLNYAGDVIQGRRWKHVGRFLKPSSTEKQPAH